MKLNRIWVSENAKGPYHCGKITNCEEGFIYLLISFDNKSHVMSEKKTKWPR